MIVDVNVVVQRISHDPAFRNVVMDLYKSYNNTEENKFDNEWRNFLNSVSKKPNDGEAVQITTM